MRTSEVALQIYGCGHALETPIMYWKLLIEVHCRDIIVCLADVPGKGGIPCTLHPDGRREQRTTLTLCHH